MAESFAYMAPGKAILFGEHFVVHGARAILCAIDRGVVAESERAEGDTLAVRSALESADLRLGVPSSDISPVLRPFHHIARSLGCGGAVLRLRSEIPAGSGLGSSSACCVAAAGSLAAICGASANVTDVALDAERSVYPDSSGADCAACAAGGVISYAKGAVPDAIDAAPPDLRLVVADSGVRHSTGEMVARVGRIAEDDPAAFSRVMAEAGGLAARALELLHDGDVPGLGRLASKNQRLLDGLGVSNGTLRKMIRIADRYSYGSKITGAGGGGCIVAIADPSNAGAAKEALAAEGHAVFEARVGRGAGPVNTL